MKVLKWAWRYHLLDVEDYDTLQEAVQDAFWLSDSGDESLERIDVYDKGEVTTYSANAVWKMERPPEWKYTGPPCIAAVEVANGDEWFEVDYAYEGDDTAAKLTTWQADLGDHVRLISR